MKYMRIVSALQNTKSNGTNWDNKDIRSTISSAFCSWSSGVSICRSVPEGSSHTTEVGGICGPHSSGNASFAGLCASNQQVVAIDPSEIASTRNLLRSRLSGRESGGIKSQGTRIKSSFILLEK